MNYFIGQHNEMLMALVSGFIYFSIARAYFDIPSNFQSEMNGIRFQDYQDFPNQWHLVTVRFREDSKEQRFTFANDIAWKAIQSFKPEYPDGAAFGKVAMMTEEDPSFVSSKVPSGTRRFQIMVKDRKKYKDTDGWGYALFTDEGKLFEGDSKASTLACVACHRIVPERDFVFSRLAQIGSGKRFVDSIRSPHSPGVIFKSREVSYFASAVPELLGSSKLPLESLEGDLVKSQFSGSLDEVVPLLLNQTSQLSKNSIFYIGPENFSLVMGPDKTKKCKDGSEKKSYRVVVYLNSHKVRDAELCK